jgi:hypothetical protein
VVKFLRFCFDNVATVFQNLLSLNGSETGGGLRPR